MTLSSKRGYNSVHASFYTWEKKTNKTLKTVNCFQALVLHYISSWIWLFCLLHLQIKVLQPRAPSPHLVSVP
jgi:hypothetical protein